jgi:DNA helicase II / ATP-dependent DNA helicase PcrA
MNFTLFLPNNIKPTPEQLAIQCSQHLHVIAQANAGAAKTTTLALRLAQAFAQGLRPSDVLVLTYTEPAVLAVKTALKHLGVARELRDKLPLHTFDDFARRQLLKIEGHAIPFYAEPERLKPFVLQAIKQAMDDPAERYLPEFAYAGEGEGAVEGLLADFMLQKGSLLLTIEAQDQWVTPTLAANLGVDYAMLKVLRAYEQIRRGAHPDRYQFRAQQDATYDLAQLLLADDAPLLGGFAAAGDSGHPLALGLRFIAVDEMHDTNRAMFTVLKHLLAVNPAAAFLGVGDVDQVIHAVTGADPCFMGHAFDVEIAKAHRLPLTASYRFGAALAAAVGALSNKLYASRSDRNTLVEVLSFEDAAQAHLHVALVARNKTSLSAKAPACELAILLRQPHQSVAIENHLLDRGVDYVTAGFDTYLMRPEVLFVRGLVAYAHNDFASIERVETRTRVLKALLLFSGASIQTRTDGHEEDQALAVKRAVEQVAKHPPTFKTFVENQVLAHANRQALQRIQAAVEVVVAGQSEGFLARFVNALQPQQLAARVLVHTFSAAQAQANIQGLVASAASYLSVASFFAEMNERELRQAAMRGKDCIVLSSIEAAKGLEFEHVLIPGLNQSEFQGEFAVAGHLADNKNLLYVGMTRAKLRLTLLHQKTQPSKYLLDMGLIRID